MTVMLKCMCSINVCGLNSKLKYGILQDHIKHVDIICLTETKCDSLIGYDIVGYKSYFMKKKYRKPKYGGIHGVCIFIKTELADYCYPLDNFESESILWIYNGMLGSSLGISSSR